MPRSKKSKKTSKVQVVGEKPQQEKPEIDITQEELNEIWKIVQDLPPDEAREFLKKFPKDVITKMRTEKNPYKLPVFKGNDNRALIFTILNLTESYATNFAMTANIGFSFRMCDEYKPKCVEHLPSEEQGEFQQVFQKHCQELEIERPAKSIAKNLKYFQDCVASLENIIKEKKENPKVLLGSDAEESEDTSSEDEDNDSDSDESSDWNKLDVADLEERLTEHRREMLEWRARQLLYNIQIQKEKRDVAAARLKSLKEKSEEIKTVVDLTTESLETLRAELTRMEKYYQEHPDAEPRDDTVKKEVMRDETGTKRKPLRSRARITNEINHYEKQLEAYTEKYQEITADLDETNSNRDKNKSEIKRLDSEDLEDVRKQYYKLYGNPNLKTTKTKSKSKTKNPWATVFANLKMQEFPLTDEDYEEARQRSKDELSIALTAEEKSEEIQNYISDFLKSFYVYNPDDHVKCAYKPNYEDPLRTPLELDEHRRIKEKEYERSLIPPSDTFLRLRRYTENNYEQLRQATDDIYPDKSDFEFNIVPMHVIEDDDPKALRSKALAWCRKYRKEFEAEPRVAMFRINNLLGPWEQNREVVDFYNENTEIVKRIIERHEEDMKMGKELMKDRVTRKRDKNIKIADKSDKGFNQFRQNMPSKAQSLGAERVTEMAETGEITASNVPRDNRSSTKKEIEVGVHSIAPVRRGRRMYGQTRQWHFNTAAKDFGEDDEIKVQTPGEVKGPGDQGETQNE